MPLFALGRDKMRCVGRTDALNRTTELLGTINPQATSDRENPPQPFNGFNTAGTPFGAGHVFALSLGGPDDKLNIVPQWAQWQQTGEWRTVEKACEKFRGNVFFCEIAYENTGTVAEERERARFTTDPFFAWTDVRIPTKFRVRILREGVTDPEMLVSEMAFNFALESARAAKPLLERTLDHRQMPAEDLRYWQDQYLLGASKSLFEQFKQSEAVRMESHGQEIKRVIDFAPFLLHPDTRSAIQIGLQGVNGFSPDTIMGLQMQRIFAASVSGPAGQLEKTMQKNLKMIAGRTLESFTESVKKPAPQTTRYNLRERK